MKLLRYVKLITPLFLSGIVSFAFSINLTSDLDNKTKLSHSLICLDSYKNSVSSKNSKLNISLASYFLFNRSVQFPIVNNELPSSNLYALYNTGYYTSDLYNNLLNYRDTFARETANQLQIPSSLVNSLANGITFDMTSSFVMPRKDQINSSILNTSDASDLKTFVTLLDAYREAVSVWNPDPTEANTQKMLDARKALDNLGYYYLTVYSSIPIDYYSTKQSYDELQKDKTFVNIGKSAGYYGYYVKYAANNKPLNINDLSKYVNFNKSINTSTTNSGINEIQTVNEVKTKLDSLNTQLEDTTTKLDSLLQTSTTIQNDIDTLNKQIDTLLSDLVSNNPELTQAASQIDAKYENKINAVTQNIDVKKQEFDKNNNFKGSGFIKHLNKTLDYTNELKDLTNIYEDKLNDLGTLFTNSEPVIKVQKQIQTLTSNVLTRVNNVTSEINTLTKELNTLSDLNTTLTSKLASINKLTYTTTTTNTTKIAVNFSLQAMQTAASLANSINTDITSYYSLLSENKLSDYFYVTKDQFATKLNELIKTQTGIDPKLSGDVINYDSSGVVVGNNNYNYTFTKNGDVLNTLVFNIELNDIKSTVHEVNVNNPKIKEFDLVLNNAEVQSDDSTDATTLLANIATYKVTLQKNQTSILNNINKLSSSLTELNKKASDINEYNNSTSLYPDYIKTQSTLNQIKEELENYKPTIVKLTQPNYVLILITASISIFILVAITLIIIYKKSKKVKNN